MILNQNFKEFIESLNNNQVRYLVVGGYAVALHGHPRYTKDMGIWIELMPKNAQRMVKVLEHFGFASHGLTPEDFLTPAQVIQLGKGEGVEMLVLTDRDDMEKVLEYVVQGNTMQIKNPAFVLELEDWIRFSDKEAIQTGGGLPARATGNPPTPCWLGKRLFRMLFRPKAENDKCARQIRSSAGIAIFVSNTDDKAHWIEAGRSYEWFALQATALGIRNAFLNQPVEESSLRPEFARAFGLGDGRPDFVVRFGSGKEMPGSLRRPLEAVLL